MVRAHKGAAVDGGLSGCRPLRVRLAIRAIVPAVLGFCVLGAGKAPVQGIHPTQIVVGTHVDLSGPLSAIGTSVRNGLVTAFDEVNRAGGVNGRSLRLIVEDNGYSARKAVSATKKLLYRDRVFAMLCPLGTPAVAKTMPLVLNNATLHLFPFTGADDTYVPMQALEFAVDLPTARQISVGLGALLAEKGALKVGVLYRNDALGKAVLQGASEVAAKSGLLLAVSAGFAPGTAHIGKALERVRAAGAELVVLGGVAQEAIAAMRHAAAEGWFPVFLCNEACYVPELPTLGGRAVSGLYAVATTPIPYPDDKDAKLRDWVRRYEKRFGTVATAEAFRAYLNARLFAEALRRAGPSPTEYRVAHALEAVSPWQDPYYETVPVRFTAHDHRGFHTGFLAVVRNGRWTTLTGALPSGRQTR